MCSVKHIAHIAEHVLKDKYTSISLEHVMLLSMSTSIHLLSLIFPNSLYCRISEIFLFYLETFQIGFQI